MNMSTQTDLAQGSARWDHKAYEASLKPLTYANRREFAKPYSLAELGCAGAKRNSGEIVDASDHAPRKAQRFYVGQVLEVRASQSDREATGTFAMGEPVVVRRVYAQADQHTTGELMARSADDGRTGLLWGWEVKAY